MWRVELIGLKKITSHCLEKQNDDVAPELLSFKLCVNGNFCYFIHLHLRAENSITARIASIIELQIY
jgi:hypothetical protein